MDSRQRQELDRHITGNYGEDQFRGEEDPTDYIVGHQWAFLTNVMSTAYDYDPAEDGPECEIITRILAWNPNYVTGAERAL